MTRDEHLAWCKERALAYLPASPQEAVTSMLSDMSKHPELEAAARGPLAEIGLMMLMGSNLGDIRSYITGFN